MLLLMKLKGFLEPKFQFDFYSYNYSLKLGGPCASLYVYLSFIAPWSSSFLSFMCYQDLKKAITTSEVPKFCLSWRLFQNSYLNQKVALGEKKWSVRTNWYHYKILLSLFSGIYFLFTSLYNLYLLHVLHATSFASG